MKKILFFPLLRMQSGHHQVAEALMNMIEAHMDDIELKKIELMSDTNRPLEKVISAGYMAWIRYAPATYDAAYRNFFYGEESNECNFKWYQPLFMRKMRQLIRKENPDLIICTHSFPSCILSKLKMKGKCHVPVINVYTDFFASSVWGRKGIDAHFLPRKHVPFADQMANAIVTGIPVHREIKQGSWNKKDRFRKKDQPLVVIAGGNSGLGNIGKLKAELAAAAGHFQFKVLCGRNKRLYREIKSWHMPHVEALPYLKSREQMNQLYEEADVLITKPGGVTISEAIRKRLPAFVHAALPGQEEINMDYLLPKGLVFKLDRQRPLYEQLEQVRSDDQAMRKWQQAIETFEQELDIATEEQIVAVIEEIMETGALHEQERHVERETGLLSPL